MEFPQPHCQLASVVGLEAKGESGVKPRARGPTKAGRVLADWLAPHEKLPA